MIGFLQKTENEQSSMRLLMWYFGGLVGAVWAVCSVGHFAVAADGARYWSPEMATIPDGVSSVIGYLVTAKVAQGGLVENGAVQGLVGLFSAFKKDQPK